MAPTNPIYARFSRNYSGFWTTYRWLIIVFFISLLCDAASTMYFMILYGPEAEDLHPAVNLAARLLGPIAGPLLGAVGKAIAGIIVGVYFRRFVVYLYITAIIISFWAAWYNIWGYRLYIPMIFDWPIW